MLALNDAFILISWSSRVIISRFKSWKPNDSWFYYSLRPPYLRPSEGHKRGVSIQSSINLGDTSAKNAQVKNGRDLILGEIVYIAIIYYILDSWLFYCMVLEPYTEGKLRARSVQIVCFNKPSQSPLKRRGIYIRSALNEIQFFKRLQTATAFYDL